MKNVSAKLKLPKAYVVWRLKTAVLDGLTSLHFNSAA